MFNTFSRSALYSPTFLLCYAYVNIFHSYRFLCLLINHTQSVEIDSTQKTSADSNKPRNPFYEAFEKDDFFKFRKLLRQSSFYDEILKQDHQIHFHLKRVSKLFDPLTTDGLSTFEMILSATSSPQEKSAKYISLIWEEYQLWKKRDLLTWQRHGGKLPIKCVIESGNIRNLFSFLIFDWHNPDDHVATKGKNYFLEEKNAQMIAVTGKSLFHKLYEIIQNGDAFHEVCLQIIYEYLSEMEERVKNEKNSKGKSEETYKKTSKEKSNEISEKTQDPLKQLVSIDVLLNVTKVEYRTKILEVLVTYWNILGNEVGNDLLEQKIKIQEISKDKNPITFFDLAFQLIERNHSTFEEQLEKYLEFAKESYGHYHETIVKPVARLLLKIATSQRMIQVQDFIFHKCPFVESNSTPLTNFQESYKFNNRNIFPLNSREMQIMASLKH